MKSNWIPTNEYYHRLLAETDAARREQLYLELFVEPWQQMMSMMQQPGMNQNDPLAGAKVWGWLLPHQTELMVKLLQQMEAANAWETGQDAAATVAAHFSPYANRLPFDSFEGWLTLADPAHFANDPQRGYTGATDWFAPRYIGQFWQPNERNLPRLAGLIAHEMHHLVRFRVFPFNPQTTTVAEYIVLEGMAESFAASLFGEEVVGYYVTEVDGAQLEAAKKLIAVGLGKTGFNVIRSYIFGDALAEKNGFEPLGGMPAFGGYAVGYHVVQVFLQRTGLSVEEATFVPADEIVAESQFFAELKPA